MKKATTLIKEIDRATENACEKLFARRNQQGV